jgi:hypothetical protein
LLFDDVELELEAADSISIQNNGVVFVCDEKQEQFLDGY